MEWIIYTILAVVILAAAVVCVASDEKILANFFVLGSVRIAKFFLYRC